MAPKRNKRIFKLAPYRRPAPQGDYFSDLPYEAQQCAQRLLWQWCKKWGTDLPRGAWRSSLRRRGGWPFTRSIQLGGIGCDAGAAGWPRRRITGCEGSTPPPWRQRRAAESCNPIRRRPKGERVRSTLCPPACFRDEL
jgi:hypothetical protein